MMIAVIVFLIATTCAAVSAWLQGTMLGPGMLVVASASGLCLAAASLCYIAGRA
jgi:hypothetical protein